jgi:REP element-mobilizing transposase RayT
MNLPHRKSIRLPGYDYSNPGYYFITICIHDRWTDFFGDVVDGEMIENHYATIVRGCWLDLPDHYPHIALDAFVIMPNHIHGILRIRPISGWAGIRANDARTGNVRFETCPYGNGIRKISWNPRNHPRTQNILIPQNQQTSRSPRAIPVAPELLGTYCPEQSGIKCDTAIYRKQSGKLEA